MTHLLAAITVKNALVTAGAILLALFLTSPLINALLDDEDHN